MTQNPKLVFIAEDIGKLMGLAQRYAEIAGVFLCLPRAIDNTVDLELLPFPTAEGSDVEVKDLDKAVETRLNSILKRHSLYAIPFHSHPIYGLSSGYEKSDENTMRKNVLYPGGPNRAAVIQAGAKFDVYEIVQNRIFRLVPDQDYLITPLAKLTDALDEEESGTGARLLEVRKHLEDELYGD